MADNQAPPQQADSIETVKVVKLVVGLHSSAKKYADTVANKALQATAKNLHVVDVMLSSDMSLAAIVAANEQHLQNGKNRFEFANGTRYSVTGIEATPTQVGIDDTLSFDYDASTKVFSNVIFFNRSKDESIEVLSSTVSTITSAVEALQSFKQQQIQFNESTWQNITSISNSQAAYNQRLTAIEQAPQVNWERVGNLLLSQFPELDKADFNGLVP